MPFHCNQCERIMLDDSSRYEVGGVLLCGGCHEEFRREMADFHAGLEEANNLLAEEEARQEMEDQERILHRQDNS